MHIPTYVQASTHIHINCVVHVSIHTYLCLNFNICHCFSHFHIKYSSSSFLAFFHFVYVVADVCFVAVRHCIFIWSTDFIVFCNYRMSTMCSLSLIESVKLEILIKNTKMLLNLGSKMKKKKITLFPPIETELILSKAFFFFCLIIHSHPYIFR